MKNIKVSIIGSGNVATNIAAALFAEGVEIAQVYSRNYDNALLLAKQVNARAIQQISSLENTGDLYILAVTDNVLQDIIEQFPAVNGLVVHTSGSVSMSVLKKFKRYGVLYPLQTFSKKRKAAFLNIPLLIEASSASEESFLKDVAGHLSSKVYSADSERRLNVHLAAVFACNFANHMYVVAEKILADSGINFDFMHPLILETASKATAMSPRDAQTGPAFRGENAILEKHLSLLENFDTLKDIYIKISNHILLEKEQ